MAKSSSVSSAEARVAAARAQMDAAENQLREAQAALNDAQSQEIIDRLRDIDWEVLYELSIGGTLVRYEDPSESNNNGNNLPRRFREKPGCLISGEFDRRTPISDRTMRVLVQSGLACWTQDHDGPHEMKLTQIGRTRTATMTRPSLKAA